MEGDMEWDMRRSGTCILPYSNKFRLILMTSEAFSSLEVHHIARKRSCLDCKERSPL